MDRVFEHGGTSSRWDESKGAENHRKHGVSFEEAVTVFASALRVDWLCMCELEGESIRIISAWRASAAEEAFYDQ